MKKKLLGGLLVVAIAAVAAFNMNMNTQVSELSLLALANVEALAGSETTTSAKCTGLLGKCYLDCTKCGAKLNAFGSGFTHTCSSN